MAETGDHFHFYPRSENDWQERGYSIWTIWTLSLDTIILLANLIFIVTFIISREIRSNPKEWLPLAMVISNFFATIINLSGVTGYEYSGPRSWPNIPWLTKVIEPLLFTLIFLPNFFLIAVICERLISVRCRVVMSKMVCCLILVIPTVVILVWEVIALYAITGGILQYEQYDGYTICFPQPVFWAIVHMQYAIFDAVLILLNFIGLFSFYQARGKSIGGKLGEASSDPGQSASCLGPNQLLWSVVAGFVVVVMQTPNIIGQIIFMTYYFYGIQYLYYLSSMAFAVIPLLWIILHPQYRQAFKKTFLPCLGTQPVSEKTKLLN